METPAAAFLLDTLASLPLFVTRIDRHDRITFINKVVPGLALDDVVGDDVFAYVASEYHEVARATFAKVRATGEAATYSAIATGPDGTVAYYDNHVLPVGDELCIVGLDVTAHEQRYLSQQQERHESDALIGRSGVARFVWFFDDDSVVWDDAMHELFGRSEPVSPAQYLGECIHYEDRAKVVEAFQRLSGGDDVPGPLHRVVRPDGTLRWVRYTGQLTTRDGRRALVGTLNDLSAPTDDPRPLHALAVATLAPVLGPSVSRVRTGLNAVVHDLATGNGASARAAADQALRWLEPLGALEA